MNRLKKLFSAYTNEEAVKIEPITGSGSNRQYFRLFGTSQTCIGVIGESIPENKAFIYLAGHFADKALPVPEVYAVSDDYRAYLQEDVGTISLFDLLIKRKTALGFEGYISNCRFSYPPLNPLKGTFLTQPPMNKAFPFRGQGQKNKTIHYVCDKLNRQIDEVKYTRFEEKELLLKTIRLLPHFQFKGADGLDFSRCFPILAFDERSIRWDLNYFKYCFLKPSGIDFSEVELENDFDALSKKLLAEESNTFMYRDFQSRNVMVNENNVHFIDFQGGRKGPVHYDVASFVWQAKADFSNKERNILIENYLEEASFFTDIDKPQFYQTLRHFVLFRTLQVLGAYGFRGYFEQKPHFLQSIPFALKNISGLLQKDFQEYPHLINILNKLIEKQHDTASLTPSDLLVTVYSFSYKKGIPKDESTNGGGFVFDCRAIHNPGRYDEYKELTGLDEPVIRFLENDGEILRFLQHTTELINASVQRYIERGFTNLMVCFGCTGGQHRSVYSAQKTAEQLHRKFGVKVRLIHREQEKECIFDIKLT